MRGDAEAGLAVPGGVGTCSVWKRIYRGTIKTKLLEIEKEIVREVGHGG